VLGDASDVDRFLGSITPRTPVEQAHYDLAVELLEDIRRLDAQLGASHTRIRAAVRASGTSVTDLFGVGLIIAAALIGYPGDVDRFRNRDRFAAHNGTRRSSSPTRCL
jgi:transposase